MSYGCTTDWAFVGSTALLQRASSTSISRCAYAALSLQVKRPRTTFGSSASTGEASVKT